MAPATDVKSVKCRVESDGGHPVAAGRDAFPVNRMAPQVLQGREKAVTCGVPQADVGASVGGGRYGFSS